VNRVAVRIVRRGDQYQVIGRRTTETHPSFELAWRASVEYFAGRKW
jgi:hypothetical protein